MAGQVTTRTQISGYRFLLRRMEHALVRRDARMLADPLRSQNRALAVGLVLAMVGIGGAGILALLKPQDKVKDSVIAVGRDSGAMFVRVDDTFHPVLNLASARLILQDPAEPSIVSEDDLAKYPRGPLLGIPGAPQTLRVDESDGSAWTVCDTIGDSPRTAVVVGAPAGGQARALTRSQAMLVRRDSQDYFVYNGARSRIDLSDLAVVRALGLEGLRPNMVSAGLLNAIPEAPPITPPVIQASGEASPFLSGRKVGTVVRVVQADRVQHYVVLRDGVQPVGEAVADLIRFADSLGAGEIPVVPPDALKNVPAGAGLPVQTYPRSAPEVVDAPVICLSWQPDEGGRVSVLAGAGVPVPAGSRMVARVSPTAAEEGLADDVYVAPGGGRFVHPVAIRSADAGRPAGSAVFVSDTGVRFGLNSRADAESLGLAGESAPAPGVMLRLLVPGPALGHGEAMVAHDSVSAFRPHSRAIR
ncbi:type VII secretion protein EccB [Hoyosella sp. YIM 151337]|nr:type VII secretion protein EccB [Hoyosella sp. YIM 151337]